MCAHVRIRRGSLVRCFAQCAHKNLRPGSKIKLQEGGTFAPVPSKLTHGRWKWWMWMPEVHVQRGLCGWEPGQEGPVQPTTAETLTASCTNTCYLPSQCTDQLPADKGTVRVQSTSVFPVFLDKPSSTPANMTAVSCSKRPWPGIPTSFWACELHHTIRHPPSPTIVHSSTFPRLFFRAKNHLQETLDTRDMASTPNSTFSPMLPITVTVAAAVDAVRRRAKVARSESFLLRGQSAQITSLCHASRHPGACCLCYSLSVYRPIIVFSSYSRRVPTGGLVSYHEPN